MSSSRRSISLDADSEGEEGKFYVWSADEIDDVLGEDDGRRFREVYGITTAGNFEGHNIPNLLAGSLAEQHAVSERNPGSVATHSMHQASGFSLGRDPQKRAGKVSRE